jgi:glutaredoxin
MRVEVFYVPNCPHHPTAVNQLKAVLRAEGIPVEIHEVAVTNTNAAQELKFRGSPTVRINGRDIAGESQEPEAFELACRIYVGAKKAGLPPIEMMQTAVRKAREREKA